MYASSERPCNPHVQVVTCRTSRSPAEPPLRSRPGRKLVIPVGTEDQALRVLTRSARGFDERTGLAVRFGPMTGRAQPCETGAGRPAANA